MLFHFGLDQWLIMHMGLLRLTVQQLRLKPTEYGNLELLFSSGGFGQVLKVVTWPSKWERSPTSLWIPSPSVLWWHLQRWCSLLDVKASSFLILLVFSWQLCTVCGAHLCYLLPPHSSFLRPRNHIHRDPGRYTDRVSLLLIVQPTRLCWQL